MKKIIVFIAVCTLLFLFLTACVGDSNEAFEAEYNTTYTVDLSGLTFRFGTNWQVQFNPTEGFSAAGDKMRKRYRDVETEFGCVFELIPWEDGGSKIIQHLAANLPIIDFLDSHAIAGGYSLYKAGLLAPLEEITTIDYTSDKWAPMAFRQYGVFGGKSYGFYQWYWEFMPEFAGTMLFNNDLVKKLALQSPYELQENGDWNWENFREYLENCLINAEPDSGLIPLTAVGIFYDIQSFMFVNGCQVINDDGAGNYSFGLDTQQGIQALEFLRDLRNDGLYTQSGQDPFTKNNNAVFLSCESFYATHHNENLYYPVSSMADLGVIPFPYGPSGSPELSSGFVHASRRMNWILAYSENEIDDIGTVLDFVFDYLDDSEGWRQYSEKMIFHSTEAFENYCFMLDKINYNYSAQLMSSFSAIESALVSVVNNQRTASEAFDSIRSLVENTIEENIK